MISNQYKTVNFPSGIHQQKRRSLNLDVAGHRTKAINIHSGNTTKSINFKYQIRPAQIPNTNFEEHLSFEPTLSTMD